MHLPPHEPALAFISYAHEDERLYGELKKHLKILKRYGLIEDWSDRELRPGNEWEREIDARLNSAVMILPLVSPDFLASDYCYEVEVKRAMERQEQGVARVLPIILRPCPWQLSPLSKLQVLPRDGRPVIQWKRRDEAWLNVIEGIMEVIGELRLGSAAAAPPAREIPAKLLSDVRMQMLAAPSAAALRASLLQIQLLLAQYPHAVEGLLLKDQIERALERELRFPAGWYERAWEFSRRHSVAIPVIAVALLFLLAAGPWSARRMGRWFGQLTPTPTATPSPTPSGAAKKAGNVRVFPVDGNYEPSGKMGDVNDVSIDKREDVTRFVYETKGRGPHKWDYTYVNHMLNPEPAQFAGVMYLYPPNNFGESPDGGIDLRGGFRVLRWEARSVAGEVETDFVIGGINWVLDDNKKARAIAPYPDSLKWRPLGTKRLGTEWQTFEYDLSQIPEEEFARVVGGFGWTISWGSNGVLMNEALTGPVQPKTFTIEIRKVRYEK